MNNSLQLRRTYDELCLTGRTPPALNARTFHLPNLTYTHPHDGERSVLIEKESLRSVGCIHARPDVRLALGEKGIHAAPLEDAVALIERRFQQDDLIWGVSGFASAGFNYTTEAKALSELYGYLVGTERAPSLSVDGGVSDGNLGLNAVIAAMHGVQTLGCIPLQGLKCASQRSFMIAWGDTYKDREILVGTIPDVLVCVGGLDGTRRECETALRNGSVVLLLALKDYSPDSLPKTYTQFDTMRTALKDDRLFVCTAASELNTTLDLVWAKAQEPSHFQRPARLKKLTHLLLGS
ncbi:MAG TPA: hypothetical protein VFH06_02600 [Candidatus Saccharimonadales bacterium]|nr:hypothetical protein [Candidatus Saccharimonadales bacterium]